MFWRFGGYSNTSSIDTILDKPDVKLEDLLDESDLIQELKQQNSKLIEFLREEPVLKQLFHHVIAGKPVEQDDVTSKDEGGEPTDNTPTKVKDDEKQERSSAKMSFFGRSRSRSKSDGKRSGDETDEDRKEAQRKKHAYVACEVLSAEIWSITEAMLEYQDHIREFWEYLRRPAPLDPVQAGYFTKVNDTLLDKKTEEMFTMLKSLDGIIPEMLKHVDCPMIMDLLLKMISLEKHEGGQGIVDWLQSQGLIPILLSYLSPENPPVTQTAAGDFLKAIITISANATGQDQTVIGPNELTRQLVSEACVKKLIEDMLNGGNPLTVGVGIVIEVIRKNNSDYDLDTQTGPEPRTTDPIYLGTLLREFAKNTPAFMKLVRNPSAKRPGLQAAFGSRIEPLGFDRFKTCELMAELLHCSNMGLLNERGSDAEMRARDAERIALKAEGKLTPAPLADSEAEDAFASSVDSHGFHHARAPDDDFGNSPEKINRLEVQNVSDEDGFEKVGVQDAQLAYQEYTEQLEEDTLPPPPLRVSRSPERQKPASDEDEEKQDHQRVSLLTQQIQDQIDETASSESPRSGQATHPDDKPAPLFAGSSSPSKSESPKFSASSPSLGTDPGTQSTATLLPDTALAADSNEPQLFEADVDGTPVIGDLLKVQFVEQDVVPTILDFFFRFPWNNFLHNVVYDVVQQVFNGSLERGYNRTLAQNLFTDSKCDVLTSKHEITQRILDGQTASDKSQRDQGMRLGYMGHLTLIAEEVCKFAERNPPELLGDVILQRITAPEWAAYVEGPLAETREKDNAVLGGVRPEQSMGVRSLSGGGMLGASGNSSALATAGLGTAADNFALHDTDATSFEDGAGGFDDGEDDDGEAPERRAVEDDEQPVSSVPGGRQHSCMFHLLLLPPPGVRESHTDTRLLQTSPSSQPAPAPLNLPPSRARLQLAARLAARHRSDDDNPEDDVDDGDELFTLASPARLSTFEVDESSSSSDEEADAGREVGSYHEDSDDDEEEELVVATGRRGPERRPSTTEVKVRRPMWDDEEGEGHA